MTRVSSHVRLAVVSAALIGAIAPAATAAADDDALLEGLAGPLGLAVGNDGTVYVAEAFGGRLSSIDKRGQVKVLIDAPGQEIAGVDAKGKGTTVFTQTLFDGAPGEEAPPLDAILGRVQPNGKTKQLASTQAYEAKANPDSGNTYGLVDPSQDCVDQVTPVLGGPTYTGADVIESHPYAVAIVPGGYAVADAAANAILRVGKNGRVSTVAVLPPVLQIISEEAAAQLFEFEGIDISECIGEEFWGEPVPTDIEVGRDGYWYVSTLPGFPEAFGSGAIWRIDPATSSSTMVADGLAGPVDIAVDHDGSFLVAELFGFQISRVRDGGIVAAQFAHSPGAIEIAPNGTIYATIGVFDEEHGGSVVVVHGI